MPANYDKDGACAPAAREPLLYTTPHTLPSLPPPGDPMIGMSNKKRADCITDYNPTTHKFPAGTMRERHGADPAFAVVREHSERNADGVFAKHYPAPKDRPKTSYNPVSQTLISEKKEQKYWQQITSRLVDAGKLRRKCDNASALGPEALLLGFISPLLKEQRVQYSRAR